VAWLIASMMAMVVPTTGKVLIITDAFWIVASMSCAARSRNMQSSRGLAGFLRKRAAGAARSRMREGLRVHFRSADRNPRVKLLAVQRMLNAAGKSSAAGAIPMSCTFFP
jgi:hypothetical protein